jgi:hypothetical protein
MNFLQKILLIVMIGVFTRNVDVNGMIPGGGGGAPPPVLYLPGGVNGTPGLQGPLQNRIVNCANASCYHIVVPNTPADIALNGGVNNAARAAAMAAGGNIYFPRNGVQPTTPEAARYSCANIDAYQLNSPITNWYVEMFGGPAGGAIIPNGQHIVPGAAIKQVGYAALAPAGGAVPAVQVACPIINLNVTMNIGSILTPAAPIAVSVANDFWQTFRKIAANPIGRVLLYRILIEIRRKSNGTNIGCNETLIGTLTNRFLFRRNNHRSLTVTLNINGGLEFEYGNSGTINFDPNDTSSKSIKIKNSKIIYSDDSRDTLDNGLFHELLHWFHFLRNTPRFYKEDVKMCNPSEYRYVSRCYYGDISELFTWGGIDDEEMRTILGTPNHNNLDEVGLFDSSALLADSDVLVRRSRFFRCRNRYLPNSSRYYNGDELSENAYRMSTRHEPTYYPDIYHLKMRFGHGGKINETKISNRFKLAHLVAVKCCNEILSQGEAAINDWRLIYGEAAN